MTLLQRPQPRPGVLAIDPYVPGKSSADGVATHLQAVLERNSAWPQSACDGRLS